MSAPGMGRSVADQVGEELIIMSTAIYATHYRVWNPAPATDAERAMIAREVRQTDYLRARRWLALPDADMIRRSQLIELVGDERSRGLYDYAREVRRELNRRGIGRVPSPRILRCEVCSHGTEGTFLATAETHEVVNRSGERVDAYLCARCWGELLTDGDE